MSAGDMSSDDGSKFSPEENMSDGVGRGLPLLEVDPCKEEVQLVGTNSLCY